MMHFPFLFQITFCSVAFHCESLVTLVIFIDHLDSAVIRAFWMPDSYADVLRIQTGEWMIPFISKPLCFIIELLSRGSEIHIFNLKWVREKYTLFVGNVWKIPSFQWVEVRKSQGIFFEKAAYTQNFCQYKQVFKVNFTSWRTKICNFG